MTTTIFSVLQLRAAKIRLHARFTVITKFVRAMLHFSMRRMRRTLKLSLSRSKMVVMSSGIGSCRSRIDSWLLELSVPVRSTRGYLACCEHRPDHSGACRARIANINEETRIKLPY